MRARLDFGRCGSRPELCAREVRLLQREGAERGQHARVGVDELGEREEEAPRDGVRAEFNAGELPVRVGLLERGDIACACAGVTLGGASCTSASSTGAGAAWAVSGCKASSRTVCALQSLQPAQGRRRDAELR